MAETWRVERNGKVTLTLLSTEETDKAGVWLSNRTHTMCGPGSSPAPQSKRKRPRRSKRFLGRTGHLQVPSTESHKPETWGEVLHQLQTVPCDQEESHRPLYRMVREDHTVSICLLTRCVPRTSNHKEILTAC